MDPIDTEQDLAIALAIELRSAHAAGDTEYEAELAVTLTELLRGTLRRVDPGERVAPGWWTMNGELDQRAIRRLLRR